MQQEDADLVAVGAARDLRRVGGLVDGDAHVPVEPERVDAEDVLGLRAAAGRASPARRPSARWSPRARRAPAAASRWSSGRCSWLRSLRRGLSGLCRGVAIRLVSALLGSNSEGQPMKRPRAYLWCDSCHCRDGGGIAPAQAQPADEFFRNKRELIFITSSNVGGGYDSYSRLLARYLTQISAGQSALCGAEHARRRRHPRRQFPLQRRAQGRLGDRADRPRHADRAAALRREIAGALRGGQVSPGSAA